MCSIYRHKTNLWSTSKYKVFLSAVAPIPNAALMLHRNLVTWYFLEESIGSFLGFQR